MNILDLKRKLHPYSGYMGGGSTTSSSTQSTELPPWLKQYAEQGLKSASELTKQPYQAFEGNRIAGFSPLQQQTQEAATKMAPTTTTGGVFGSGEAQQYMNPYMQNVVDIQQREAQRTADIAGTQRGAQAAQAGAFGGSRQAIMDAEAARNLATQKGDIQAQGSNLAFQQAQQQFNADQERRLKAEGQGFQQGVDVNRLQNAYGAQQQAMQQQGLTQSYEDFQRQQQDPYNKLSFMSSMVRGTPGSVTTTTGTTPNPSFAQTAGSLAMGAYGLRNFFADGGSVDSQQNIESIVRTLLDPQLDQAEEAAKVRGDAEQLRVIQMEKAARASMRRGIGSVPVDMDKMMPTAEGMARGGIVAFAEGGGSSDYFTDAYVAPEVPEMTSDEMRAELMKKLYASQMAPPEVYKGQTPLEQQAEFTANLKKLQDQAGPNQYAEERANIKKMSEDNAQNLKQGKGIAALRAAAAMLKGGNAIRGFAAGAEEFGTAFGEMSRAAQAEQRALQSMRVNLADAERKEKMGLHRDAAALTAQAEKDRRAADVFRRDEQYRKRTEQQGLLALTKPDKPVTDKEIKLGEQLGAAEIAFMKNPNDPNIKATVMGLRLAADRIRSSSSISDFGPGRRADTAATLTQSAEDKEEARRLKDEADIAKVVKPLLDPAYQAAMAKGDQAGMAAAVDALRDAERARRRKGVVNKSVAPDISSVAGAPAGSTIGNLVAGKGHEVLSSSGTLLGYAQ